MAVSKSLDRMLRDVYLADPIVRFMGWCPVGAGMLSFALGFVLLVVLNWLNGSLVWSSPRKYDYTFLSTPIDWLYVGVIVPVAIWALGHWYGSTCQAMRRLVDEAIIDSRAIEETIQRCRERPFARRTFRAARCVATLLFFGFLCWSFPSWCPAGKSTWIMVRPGIPSALGILLIVLGGVLSVVGIGWLSDTFRLATFHRDLLRSGDCDPTAQGIGFFPRHPDGAFGYGLLAPSMEWAGFVGLCAIPALIVALTAEVVTRGDMSGLPLSRIFLGNAVVCLAFWPWVVFGPVLPFILMLRRRKTDQLRSLRRRYAQVASSAASEHLTLAGVAKEWTDVSRGRPYIMRKKALLPLALSAFAVQLPLLFKILVWLTRANLRI